MCGCGGSNSTNAFKRGSHADQQTPSPGAKDRTQVRKSAMLTGLVSMGNLMQSAQLLFSPPVPKASDGCAEF